MKYILILVALAACSNEPAPITPTPDNPCGYQWHSCPKHMCCLDTDVCGGSNTGCPEGMCCFIGDEHNYGTKPPTKQRQPKLPVSVDKGS